jgi:hypothetical protein
MLRFEVEFITDVTLHTNSKLQLGVLSWNLLCQVYPTDDFVRLACAVEETAGTTKLQRREVLGDILLNVDEEHSRGRKLFGDFIVALQHIAAHRRDKGARAEALARRFAEHMLPPHLLPLTQVLPARHCCRAIR